MSRHASPLAGPHPLVTGEEAGAADRAAVDAGDTWDGLLARAGAGLARGVVEELRHRTGGVYGRRALLVAGKGDNGGDAWVAAARLRDRGVACTVLAVHGRDVGMSDHSARARRAWLHSDGASIDGLADRDRLEHALRAADVVVDAVLGTGISGAPREAAADAIDLCNEARVPVVACDVPSGLDAATGTAAGAVVRAHRTVTFGATKRGLALHPGAQYAGVVDVVDLGDHWSVPEPSSGGGWWATSDDVARLWALPPDADKRRRGRVLVVAGSHRYAGAAALCAAAATRSGAGLVTLATTAPRVPVLALEPGVMVVDVPALDPDEDGGAGGPAPSAVDRVLALLEDVDAVVLGPGCGHGAGTRALADALLATDVPLVLDADGLNVFRDDAEALRRSTDAPLLLTPHERELGRLTGVAGDEAAARRHELVPALSDDLGALVVGKGPRTIVADPWWDERHVVTSGGPALGTGGSGDVLAGMLGAAAAATSGRGDHGAVGAAAVATVHRHGMLGDRVAVRTGGRATARDLLDELPLLLEDLVVRDR